MAEHDHWLALARFTPLALLTDYDGTLVPFAPTPEEARLDPARRELLHELASLDGVTVAVVSGRPREALDAAFPEQSRLLLMAEHGGWRRDAGAWQAGLEARADEIDGLAMDLLRLAARMHGALVERKTWSVAFHLRRIPPDRRDEAMVALGDLLDRWLADHPSFGRLDGAEVVEVRPVRMTKATAVAWIRERAGAGAKILAFGDDVTDEDVFLGLSADDESVLVGAEEGRATAARWRLGSIEELAGFLRWLRDVRRGDSPADPAATPRRIVVRAPVASSSPPPYRLLVISNRLPELRSAADSFDERRRNVGGLVSALEPALEARHGVWLGWSGRTSPHADASRFGLDESTKPQLAWVDLPEAWHRHYYNGFCNGALWPLLHSFPGRMQLADADWDAYRQANAAFAAAAAKLVGPDDTVWIHDYHLLLLPQRLREEGHRGPIGLFLHVPFPAPDLFFLLPWAEEILGSLLDLDLIGFHTPGHVANFRQAAAALPGSLVGDDAIQYRGRRTRVGAFPIGIIPEGFQEPPSAETAEEMANLKRAISPGRLVLGVDRLDYTKGIPERLTAFARMLELWPEWRRKVSLVQISVPSRGDVTEYAEQRERIERVVGRTNGEIADPDWIPVRYLYRSFGRNQLSELYRFAAVGYVTPLRDGMNLVAKEYVAAQDPDDPGVLLLSRFAGAAVELADALLTNPWHTDGLARDLDRALRMPLEERRSRHAKLLAAVSRTTAVTWAEDFLSTLAACGPVPGGSDGRGR